jgi:hypothetical protein
VLVAPVKLDESVMEPPAIVLGVERLVAMLGVSRVTVRVIAAQCVSAPFVPVTLSVYMPDESPALMLRIEEPNPPEVSVRLLGESVAEGPDGVIFTLRATVPTKPLTLAKLTVVCWL